MSKPPRKTFVAKNMDDAGLSPECFRIWCHIQRRGTLFGSVPGIAKHCGIGRDGTREALRWLVANKWATAIERTGQTTEYTALHPYLKAGATPTENGRGKGKQPLPESVGHPYRKPEGTPTEISRQRYSPIKETPTKAYKQKFRKG